MWQINEARVPRQLLRATQTSVDPNHPRAEQVGGSAVGLALKDLQL
jgi:hypothetical protein